MDKIKDDIAQYTYEGDLSKRNKRQTIKGLAVCVILFISILSEM